MCDYTEQVAGVLHAVKVVSATSHSWFGNLSPSLSDDVIETVGPDAAHAYLLYNLTMQLYANFFCAGAARPRVKDVSAAPQAGQLPLAQLLSRSNTGRGMRDAGWTVVREEPGAVVVARGGLCIWAPPGRVEAAADAVVAPGRMVTLLTPKELLRHSPGFYVALSDAYLPADGSAQILRIYWHGRSDGAAALMHELTSRLNKRQVAFRLKVLTDEKAYARRDSAVLYTVKADYDRVGPIVADVYRTVAPKLRPGTPALTKTLFSGVGLAEDPGMSLSSFGMHRCEALAAAIVATAYAESGSAASRLNMVCERLRQSDVDLAAPYLNPGSVDRYTLQPE